MTQEITIPLDLKRVVLMGADETKLGDKKGAIRQYRKGNLHIREYEDRLTVHADKVDPREDPMGHLIHDAQEVLVGLAGAAISGAAIGSYIYKIKKNSPYRKQQAVIGGLAASLAAGYASYRLTKKLKEEFTMVLGRTIYVFIKLLPSIMALRKDRVLWISDDKKDIDEKRFQKHARRILNTCITLGPIYIKWAQWLSSRADILPEPYLKELSKLQDDVPAESFDKVRPVIEQDIGKIDEKFDSLDTTALSGASLGQVYRGTRNGQQVIVKVKRPGIEKVVEKDLKVLMKIIPFAMKFVDPNLRFSIIPIMKQFVESMHEELDYTKESDNLKTIKKNMEPYNNVVIPKVHDDYSTKNILTMEYIPGIKVTDIQSLDEKGIDRQKLVIDVHKVFFTMLLKHSIFHADPHPGNISVKDDGTLILYDFGMIGRINDETRVKLVRLYLGLIEKNPPRTVTAMDELGMLAPDFNREVIEKGIELSIKSMYGKKPDEMEVEQLMNMANKTMSKFPFKLPKHLALYLRMSTIIEGIYHTHKVDFKFIKVLGQILEEESLIKDAYIEEIKRSFSRFAKTIEDTLTIAPEIKKFMDDTKLMQQQSGKKNNSMLAGSIFAAAVFLGSAFMFQTNETVGVLGLIASGVIIGISALFRKK